MILILNGSPNKSSMTLALTEHFVKHLNKEFEIIHCYDLDIVSCNDCKFCDHKLACNKVDDMEQIYQALLHTDTLILSSPIYFGAFSNELMQVINRFQRYFSERFTHNKELDINIKNLISVVSAGSKSAHMFQGARLTFDILAKLFQATETHFITASDTDHIPAIENKDALSQIDILKKKMVP